MGKSHLQFAHAQNFVPIFNPNEVFSLESRYSGVSLRQFRRMARKLESNLVLIRPEIKSELIITFGDEKYSFQQTGLGMDDLDKSFWDTSIRTQLRIFNEMQKNYDVWLGYEKAEPGKLFFYGQGLDSRSREVFNGFKRNGFFYKVGDGRHRLSGSVILSDVCDDSE
jgi:hypothetical protein